MNFQANFFHPLDNNYSPNTFPTFTNNTQQPGNITGTKRMYPYHNENTDFNVEFNVDPSKQVRMDPYAFSAVNSAFMAYNEWYRQYQIYSQNWGVYGQFSCPCCQAMQNNFLNMSQGLNAVDHVANICHQNIEKMFNNAPLEPLRIDPASQNLGAQDLDLACHKLQDECDSLKKKIKDLLQVKKNLKKKILTKPRRNKENKPKSSKQTFIKIEDEEDLMILDQEDIKTEIKTES